jgi:hypothetical protein
MIQMQKEMIQEQKPLNNNAFVWNPSGAYHDISQGTLIIDTCKKEPDTGRK